MITPTDRLERLERENRRMKLAGVVALAVIVAVVLMGQATQSKVVKRVEAEEFVLRDSNGKIRARLAMNELGAPSLSLLYTDGTPVAELWGGVIEKEAHLSFYHQNGRRSAFLSTARGASALAFIDKDGNFRVTLSIDTDGLPAMRLADKNSKVRAGLTVDTGGNATLSFSDKADKVIWSAP